MKYNLKDLIVVVVLNVEILFCGTYSNSKINKFSGRSMKVELSANLGKLWQKGLPTNRPTNQPTDRRKDRVTEKFHSQKEVSRTNL